MKDLLLVQEKPEALSTILHELEQNLSVELTNRKINVFKIKQPSNENNISDPQTLSAVPVEVSVMENSIQGSTRSLIKIIFLRSYIFQLKKAIEDDEVAAASLTISSLARLIDSSIFGSSSERIAGIVLTSMIHSNEK